MTSWWLVSVAAAAGAAGWLGRGRPVAERAPVLPLMVFAAACAGSVALGRAATDAVLARSAPVLVPAVATGFGALLVCAVAWQRGGGRAAGLLAPAVLLVAVSEVVASRLSDDGAVGWRLPLAALGVCVVVLRWGRVPVTRAGGRVLAVVGVVLVALPLIPVIGVQRNGAILWVAVPGVGVIQPGELGRVLLVLGVAALVGEYAHQLRMVGRRFGGGPFAYGALVACASAGLIAAVLMVVQRDLGPALLVVTALGVTIWLVAGRARYFVVAAGTLAALAVALYPLLAYLQARVAQWRDPFGAAGGEQTQVAAADFALAWGGWWGRGLGAGLTVGRGRIQAAESDYVLAQIGAEAGLVGLGLVLSVIGLLLVRLWQVVATTDGGAPTAATAGLAALLSVQTVVVTWGVAGAIPLTGVTTPLLSAGGSSLVAVALLLSLVVVIAEPARSGREPDQRVRRTALGAAVTTAALVSVAALTFADTAVVQAADLDRTPGNYQALWATAAPRGRILAADGTVLAASTHDGAADLARRVYPGGAAFADPVGYRIPLAGARGTEQAWAGALRCGGGAPASADLRAGYPDLPPGVDPADCAPADVLLGIDPALQRRALAALGDRTGAVLVLDAGTGTVLAAVSTPTVEPGPLAGPDAAEALGAGAALQAAPAGPERPGAWAVPMPPGSVFKIVTGAAALRAKAEGALPGQLDDVVRDCPGPHLVDAFAYSCNQPFEDLALRLGTDRMAREAAAFGIGGRAELSGLPVAASALYQDPAGAPESGALKLSGIGQGEVRATLLHVTSAAATIADDGRRVVPRLVTGLCVGGASRWTAPVQVVPAVDAAVAEEIATGLRAVVTRGTARDVLRSAPGAWAAKTGTAELGDGRQAAWIVGFPTAPKDGPPVAVGVLVQPDAGEPMPTGGHDAAAVLAALAGSGPLEASGSGPSDGSCGPVP
jgi:cell division protein FtsW (lipid II flippase)